MDIETFRKYCLSFNGAMEKLPFEKATSQYDKDLLVFYVADKWFCFVNIDKFDFCDLKCDPEESKELQEKYQGIKPGYHMNKKHWISAYFNGDVPDPIIKELVRKSYELIVKSFPLKIQESLKYKE
ncbi:MmcQ/YjbR family DNA-binding protein [Pedobacter sp. ISL-68]|uniref:MmcQ/YjbR family DNA-binding protein n=1 Tax=unclassified Pedobacter TaxID=2628915 RepID=UPI001BEC1A5C|nr:MULTISPECIES: MmcQ/YjbR family DNA-binding protein [unclassified Pedobacter]MBT2561381.1 MmcQ/YjbR family DNA-binding protein [Pedobacter sp. ISL-64]MBT2590770.1 MmcQ/YjbR family DNA-binding protein [Pedobacter sp. ISL-68]